MSGDVPKRAKHFAEEGHFPITWPPSLSNSNYKYFFFKRAKGLEAVVEGGQIGREVAPFAFGVWEPRAPQPTNALGK